MATKNFRSTVLEPTSEFAHGDKLRFTALATVGEVLKGSFSETTIGEDGVYSVDLQYGKHRIDYKPYEGVWRHFADVEVNADTLATTLQDLALASVPVTDETVLVLQGILADAEAAKAESAAIRDEAADSAAAAAADAAKLADITPEDIGAVNNYGACYLKPLGGTAYFGGETLYSNFRVDFPFEPYMISMQISILNSANTITSELFLAGTYSLLSKLWLDARSVQIGGTIPVNAKLCFDAEKNKPYIVIDGFNITGISFCITKVVSRQTTEGEVSGLEWTLTPNFVIKESEILQEVSPAHYASTSGGSRVRSMQHDNINYQFVDLDEALSIGILQSDFDAALAEQQAGDLFESEKSIALQIFADFNLGTGEQEITGSDISDVRAYIQSIDPAKGLKAGHLQRAKIPRPSIFDRYSE